MKSRITGFGQDDAGDWVARLACGHRQHVRHDPPWRTRPWVLTAEGRQEKIGASLECPECGPGVAAPAEAVQRSEGEGDEQGGARDGLV